MADLPPRGFSRAFLSSVSCRISDKEALSCAFFLSIRCNNLFVSLYSCKESQNKSKTLILFAKLTCGISSSMSCDISLSPLLSVLA